MPELLPVRSAFSDEEIARLLELMKGSDSVELKLTVPQSHQRSALGSLGLDPLEAQIRQVFFFDTPDLVLNKHGVVVRARRMQVKGGDSVVKLRPVVPSELPKALRKSTSFRVEVDAMPNGFVCSGTLKGAPSLEDVRSAVAGKRPLRTLFSKEQRSLFIEHAPKGMELDELTVLGPIFVLKLRFTPSELQRRIVAEMWLYPDGSRLLELSTRCMTAEAFQVAVETRAFLAGRGVDLSGEQETKTHKALEYFANASRGGDMNPAEPIGAGQATVGGIVPRWEWRTFGERVAAADARFLALAPPERVQESDELYLLSLESDASVKVRDGLMDVKQLENVNDDGLEQWRPVMKSTFPLAAADVVALLSVLGIDPPSLERKAYTLDQFVAEVVEPTESLRAVSVHKHREHYMSSGCMAELSEVSTGSGSARTIAIESEDPALVIQTVRDFGLAPVPNVCLTRVLRGLADFGAARYAAIDVGTNSVKFHLGERRPNGEWLKVVDRAEITRLGEGLDSEGRLGPEAIARTVDAIAGMVEEATHEGAVAIAVVGTAGLRIAPNRAELIDAVLARCGVEVEVIPGDEEARLAYLAATSSLDIGEGSLAVFDTGGGSSQFTFGEQGRIDEQFSVDVGAARFTERFDLANAVTPDQLQAVLSAISTDLERLDGRPSPDALVGLGGAVTNLAAVKHALMQYDPQVIQGTVLDRDEIDRQIELYRSLGAEERRTIVGLQPKRAEVILAGACIVHTVLAKLACDSFTVSDRGLRHGVLAQRFG